MNFCYLDKVKISSFNQSKHVYVYINVYMCICIYVTMCICVAIYVCVNEYIYICVQLFCALLKLFINHFLVLVSLFFSQARYAITLCNVPSLQNGYICFLTVFVYLFITTRRSRMDLAKRHSLIDKLWGIRKVCLSTKHGWHLVSKSDLRQNQRGLQ